jgi:Dolichyl-phosphate-mannose-protein mannosyltransferase
LSSFSAPADLDRRPPALTATSRSAVALVLLLSWTLALHIPALGKRGGDDPFFIEVAHLWLRGAPPYLNAFDVKPPGYFFLLALAETVFGPTQTALNALTVFCEAATAACLWLLGRRLGVPAAGAFAAFGYPVLSQTLANNPGYPPLALATTAAFLIAASELGWRTRVVGSGLAIGFALTIKQSACLEALPLLWLLIREPQAQGQRGRSVLAFAAAVAAAPLGFALALAAQGAFVPFFDDVVLTALRRPGLEPETTVQIFAHFVSVQKKIFPLVCLAAVGVWRFRTLLPGVPAGRAEALVLWLAVSWLELALQHARWVLYLGPTLAPVLLLAGAGVVRSVQSEWVKRLALAALLLATAVNVYPFRYWLLLGAENAEVYAEATQAIAKQNPEPGDRLLGIGLLETAQLNTDTGLAPPSRYFYWLHLACDFPGAGPQRLREALASAPRFLVVATNPYRPYCEAPSTWPLVRATLAQGYRRIAETSLLDVYERQSATRP